MTMNLMKKFKEKRKQAKGFLTKKGRLWNYSEIHAFGLGMILYSMAFLVPVPYGRALIFSLGLGALGVHGFRKLASKLHDDIIEQSHYFLLGCALVEVFIQFSGVI